MDYKQMIKGENTDKYYDLWSEYRKELTDYVQNVAESCYIKEYLRSTGAKKIMGKFDLGEIAAIKKTKPCLAIWGAGGCNDIDIKALSRFFKIILIDHETDRTEAARKKYGLSKEECACIDLKFWDVTPEDYLMLEALIKDEAPPEDIQMFMRELVDAMGDISYENVSFDISLAAGIASQLNSRLAALLHVYRYPYDMRDFLRWLNKIAAERFFLALNNTTCELAILGLEEKVIMNYADRQLEKEIAGLNEEIRHNQDLQRMDIVEVEGNKDILELLHNRLFNDGQSLFNQKYMLWNFTEEKAYLMKLLCYEL